MTENKNATSLYNANGSNMEKHKKALEEIVKNGNLKFKDVTFAQNSYPQGVGEYRALVGFASQQDAQLFAELTGGEFSMFYCENGWQLLSYRGGARITDIYTLAGGYPVVFLEGNENLHQLCEEILGISLVEHIRDSLDLGDEVPESWIRTAIERYETRMACYPVGIREEDEDFYDEIEDKIIEHLRYFENFKGCRGYVVIDDVNWSVVGEHDSEYPAHYKEDNKQYIFGVMYPIKREEEIREMLEG